MIRKLIIGYCFSIHSERRLCEEVHLNLAYRWFCRLGLKGATPDHSTFAKNRNGQFRDNDTLRFVFEKVLTHYLNKEFFNAISQKQSCTPLPPPCELFTLRNQRACNTLGKKRSER